MAVKNKHSSDRIADEGIVIHHQNPMSWKFRCCHAIRATHYSGLNHLKPMTIAPFPSQAVPPKPLLNWQKALLWQSLGFLIVVVLTWFDALFHVTHAILGLPHQERDLNRTAMTTVVSLLVWTFSAHKIYLFFSRPSYLENCLHFCAWCRKIEYLNRWLSLEAHFNERTGGQLSHGICLEYYEKTLRQALDQR